MVSSRNEGGVQVLSASVRKTIQSIKEVVRSHSDGDIYVTLQECNMDPNETIQKLLHQDPFHEVKRKRDKKKENSGNQYFTAVEHKINSVPVRVPEKQISYPDRSTRKGGSNHKASSGVVREFRVVRDNRINQNITGDTNSAHRSTMIREGVSSNLPLRSSAGTSGNKKFVVEHPSPQALNRQVDSLSRQGKVVTSSTGEKVLPGEKQTPMPNVSAPLQSKTNDAPLNITNSSNSYVLGVYSSFSDPVHVPSSHSRPGRVGAIKREFGVVGTGRQPFENPSKPVSSQTSSNTDTSTGQDTHSKESTKHVNSTSKSDQFNQKTASDPAPPHLSASRSSSSNYHGHHSGRLHQLAGHQKASQHNKEWKPKSSRKSSANRSGMLVTDASNVTPTEDNSDGLVKSEVQMNDKISGLNISDKKNVIIAAHIRVTESDRRRLTFGTLGIDIGYPPVAVSDDSAAKLSTEPSGSVPVTPPESTETESGSAKLLGLMDEPVRTSGSNSPASGVVPDHLIENNKSSSTQNLDKSVDVGLVQGENQSYPPESLQQQDVSEIPRFSGYDSQIGYDMSYFRPMVEEAVRGPDLQSLEEVSSSHLINNIPASTIAMVQQQQLAQMYPSMHVSHYANLMPYRQFISPVYGPPVPMPGYSNSPAYSHPSSGSSYLLMPGNSTHLTQSGLKYGVQQFKPVPTGNPNGFGNFPSPTGYAINTPGVGNAGLEDSSRLKFKDSLYVPSPQADTNEIWMNTRDLPSLQSASFYNLPAQTPHAAYLSSHGSHASFNPASAQSSHMQFPGMYHPPTQPVAIASPHPLGPAIGGNVGVGTPAPGAQMGAYQQTQLGHLNWNGNF